MRLATAAILACLLGGCNATGQAPPEAETPLIGRLPCAPRHELVDFLAGAWAQRPVAQGLAVPGGLIGEASVIEVLATADGGSWTAILTAPTGISCVLAGGEAWQPLTDSRAHYRRF